MGKFVFTDEQKELLKNMRVESKSTYVYSTYGILNECAKELDIIVEVDGCIISHFKRDVEELDIRKRIGQFVATLMFLKKLEEKGLIYRVYSKDYNCLTFPKGFNTNNLRNDNYGEKKLHKDCDIVEFLKSNHYFILDPELIDYIKNDCRTEKKRQYDEQLGFTRKSLDRARNSNWIAGIALIVSAVGVGGSAYWNHEAASASTKIDTLQFQQICHSMESPKLVKVENDTFVVNAKGDTISFKHVAKPVTQLPQSADSTKSENVKNGTFGCRCKCRGCKRQANDKANDKPVTNPNEKQNK